MVAIGMQEVGIALPENWLQFFKSCDRKRSAQLVCYGASPAKRSKYFWHDIGDQLPDHGRLALDQLRPRKGESSDVAIAKYDVMTAYLAEHGREFFGPGATNDRCAFHLNQNASSLTAQTTTKTQA